MKVTFFSNYLLHHQTPFCEAMAKKLGNDFKFVATERISEMRLKAGYKDLSHATDYSVNAYESQEQLEMAKELMVTSDVVIFGDAPKSLLSERLKLNKLTFRFSERFFRNGRWRILDPRVFVSYYRENFKNRRKNLYMLCASAYTAPDCRFIFSYPNKTYKWGYFPPVKQYEDVDKLISGKKPKSILCVSRLIPLKHVEQSILVVNKLIKNGYCVSLDIVGNGEMEGELKGLVNKLNIQDRVHFLGSMPAENVREYMEKAEIFLFTSNKKEGWGAVLNESMNSACAVVANRAIGSVPYLIEDNINGLTYNGKVNDLYKKVKFLLDNDDKRREISKEAYNTLNNKWNAEVATNRLLKLVNNLMQGKDSEFVDGPCSKD